MTPETYQELLDFLNNHGQQALANSLFKLFVHNRKLSAENKAYKIALSSGITLHIHNDGKSTEKYHLTPDLTTVGEPRFAMPALEAMIERKVRNELELGLAEDKHKLIH